MAERTYSVERLKCAEMLILELKRFPPKKRDAAALAATIFLKGIGSSEFVEETSGEGADE